MVNGRTTKASNKRVTPPLVSVLVFFPIPLPYSCHMDFKFPGICPLGLSRPPKRSSSWLGVSYGYSDFPNPSLPRDRVFACLRHYAFAVSYFPLASFLAHLTASTACATPTHVFDCIHGPRAGKYRFPPRYQGANPISLLFPPYHHRLQRLRTMILSV